MLRLLEEPNAVTAATGAPMVLQRRFDQTVNILQESHHGGVKSQYDPPNNVVELHIEAGANLEGQLMEDFLLALYEARDTIRAGQTRNAMVPGNVFMRPGGAKVLKMTMELLGEGLGAGASLGHARQAKAHRQQHPTPPSPLIPADRRADVLDPAFEAEHQHYRDALVGVGGITMNPIGGGTSGGAVDMLDTSAANAVNATNERALYDTAIHTLRPFLSIAVTVQLAQLERIITMMETRAGFWKALALKAKYLVTG